jgi:hypothetical protein
LFCANFYCERGRFAACKSAWCGPCYKEVGYKNFPRQCPLDDEGVDQTIVGDELRFLEARNGDNLMTPFQCDVCHFRNIQGRDPSRHVCEDNELLEYIRRANMDSLWAREKSTVGQNLRNARRMEALATRLLMPSITPPMGPFPLHDDFGMKAAVAMLDKSLDKGKYVEHVQFETFRKLRTAVTNVCQAGVGGLSDTVGAYERNKVWISKVPTHTFWFSRFVAGCHKRVGQIRMPDRIFSIDALHAADKILEAEYKFATDEKEKLRIAEIGAWITLGFCTALRGEEMPLIDLFGTAKSIRDDMHPRAKDPHFKAVVIGRTKGDRDDGKPFAIPCVKQTAVTNIRPGDWVTRLVNLKHKFGFKNGKLFARKLRPTRMMEFEDDFFRVLERVQATTDFVPKDICVRDEFGISRSIRRSVTAHARNLQVDRELLEAIARWGKEANTRIGVPRLDMVDTYSTLDAIAPLVLEFSRSL